MARLSSVLLMLAMLSGALPAQGTQAPPPAAPMDTPPPAQANPAPARDALPLPEPALPQGAPTQPAAAATMPPKRTAVRRRPPNKPALPAAVHTPAAPVTPAVATPAVAVPASAVTPPPQAAFVSLSRIRLIRERSFEPPAAPEMHVRGVGGPNGSQESQQPGTVFDFKIRPAQGWGIVSIDDAKLSQVVSQSGSALATQPVPQNGGNSASGSSTAGFVLPVEMKPEQAELQIRTDLPPRADETLAKLSADFEITVGYRQVVSVSDLAHHAGQAVDLGQRDVTFTVVQVGSDLIEVSAAGQFEKVGAISVTAPGGEKIEPYSAEVKATEQAGVPRKKTWSFSFSSLPPTTGLNIDVYPVRQQVHPRYAWNDVPLP